MRLKIFYFILSLLLIAGEALATIPCCGVCEEETSGVCAKCGEGVDLHNGTVTLSLGGPARSWSLGLNYSTHGKDPWATSDYMHVRPGWIGEISNIYTNAHSGIDFFKSEVPTPDGLWRPSMIAGEALQPYTLEEWEGETTEDDRLVMTHESLHLRRRHIFHHPSNMLPNAGKLDSIEIGTHETGYVTIMQYNYDQYGKLLTAVDKYGVVVHYEYVGDLLKKVIEPDLSESVNNKHGRVTWLEWADSNRLLRMKVGIPTEPEPDYGAFGQEPDEEDYYWQVTEFDYTLVGGRQLLSR